MSARSVKLVYVSGNNNLLLKAASYLMTIRLAYYYSKDFIRFKSRRDEVVWDIVRELHAYGLKTRVTYTY